MNISEKLKASIPSIIDLARLAPSVHNSQPWLVEVAEDQIIVRIDPRHKLKDGDPTGRQTIISLGIFAEAIAIAATNFGFTNSEMTVYGHQARIKLTPSDKSKRKSATQSLKKRVTDRSIYKQVDITPAMQTSIIHAGHHTKAKIWVITDWKQIETIADLTAKGIGVALSSPGFRDELSKYLVVPWSRKKRGISTSSLYIPKLLAVCEPLLMRLGIGLKAEADLEHRRWLSASGIVLITTAGDVPEYWFEAGRSYLHAALAIEELGLSQATSAATVEASNYHEDVEALVGTEQRLQSVIRIGKGAKHRNHSPRVQTEELLTSN